MSELLGLERLGWRDYAAGNVLVDLFAVYPMHSLPACFIHLSPTGNIGCLMDKDMLSQIFPGTQLAACRSASSAAPLQHTRPQAGPRQRRTTLSSRHAGEPTTGAMLTARTFLAAAVELVNSAAMRSHDAEVKRGRESCGRQDLDDAA